ncbi:hypothetical protein CO115_04775 [Candidatus Falkowbacteria bacterium CG_4_9_14_3_um_filter_36_9]|nr:MAG: hypothetical protein COX67_03765 [Candidatus Falkowbacteria bacterium CG_4_10_14_0_2_um_filter_36_22]PJB18349.1 MAG: hypothetical protein CO115_04775 [Candidatus Falkowbacteria bacterium CG_4_9_14_3_um_filter_36_9]
MKKIANIITLIFLFIFALQLASLIFFSIAPETGQALELQVPIGDTKTIDINKPNPIGDYIQAVYKYAVGAVGIIATVVMMFGGILWIVAGGNAERISNAKSWIGAALTGLILVMTSYLILYTVNPKLVQFEPINIAKVKDKSNCNIKPDNPTYITGDKRYLCADILGSNWITIFDKNICAKNIFEPNFNQTFRTLCCQQVTATATTTVPTNNYKWAEQQTTCEELYGKGNCEETDNSKCGNNLGSNSICCWHQ